MNEAYEAGYFLTIEEKVAIASRQEIVANDMPNEDISISLQEPDSNRRNAFVYNNECHEEDDLDLNTVSGDIRSSARDLNRLSRTKSNFDRDLRRREASLRRSTSLENQ